MIDGEVDGGDRGERGETDQEREREKQLKRDVAERETRVRERDRGPIPNGPLRPTHW